jgi:very-short-patch-repair endonuclease
MPEGWSRRRPVSDMTRGRAKDLRQQLTQPEQLLWSRLRSRRLAGLKFLRQAPVGPFIVDYVCREKRLVVELDGASHDGRGDYDKKRQQLLEAEGLTVFRVSNDHVLEDLESVLLGIMRSAGIDLAEWDQGNRSR